MDFTYFPHYVFTIQLTMIVTESYVTLIDYVTKALRQHDDRSISVTLAGYEERVASPVTPQ